mmetsp:Transcript_66929/g.118842  ORF Transcript_66929/g.118842 Transcript_66929/m.118842 type:complete len:81 (+) Transcript_66929:426-668(+)
MMEREPLESQEPQRRPRCRSLGRRWEYWVWDIIVPWQSVVHNLQLDEGLPGLQQVLWLVCCGASIKNKSQVHVPPEVMQI